MENKPKFEGHDFVLASGLLQDSEAPLRERYDLCGTAAAFNCFFTWYDNHSDHGFRMLTRWSCWDTAVASRHAGCFTTSMWHTTLRSKCIGLKDCCAEKSPGLTNDRGKGAQRGCFLGRKKDLFERFFPAATRRGAGIFCCPIFEEIRVLYTIEHLVHPRQRIAVDMMDRIKT